ncbi:penicillin-binding transpeptidase domain-containing protein [Sutcliffiella deserti]|uniref:penicillin-binding transpeptidase domain-containing protein n=1 Tax=Sutcliffiella deserti TaxID=2875501 RepID=UPI001CBFA209|nr:penicillin-binding transpeptidase domain-containing protein [Sutcliffiella deserti]
MKKLLIMILLAVLLSGCQEEEKVSPYTALAEYIEKWQASEFNDMYDTYLTTTTKTAYTNEVFSEKYEKLYEDLETANLSIEILDKEIPWEEEASVTIPGKISFDTYVGKIEYSKDFVLEKTIAEDEKEKWNIQWDPSFILPNLELTDKVHFSTTYAERGEILDTEGNPMATNGEVFQVGVVPGKFNEEESLQRLSEILNMDEEYIKSQYTLSWAKPDYVMPIKKFLLEEEQTVMAAEEIEGISVKTVEERIYPLGQSAAHLIGYIGEVTAEDLESLEGYSPGDMVGKRGLEQLLEDRLKAKNGEKVYLEKEDGSQVDIVASEPINGETITLTINGKVQQNLFETLKEESGTAAVMDPTSGKVRGLVSLPTFDPNDYVLGLSSQQRQALEENPEKPTINRFSYTYSPGSTMKLLTAVVGLVNGEIDPAATYEINEKSWQKDDSWGGYKVNRYYEEDNIVNLESGLKFSDNIYFARAGLDMGAEKFQEGLSRLGVGEALPFIYPTVKSQISNSETIEDDVLLADTAYGQGELLMNIVHLASIYGGVVNNGKMMQPILLEEEEETVWQEEIVSSEQAILLKDYLRKIVTEGSSQKANVQGREMAGKTGTSEMKTEQGPSGDENGLFVAYDQQDPTLLTAMLVEGVDKKKPRGSTYVVELTRSFFEKIDVRE